VANKGAERVDLSLDEITQECGKHCFMTPLSPAVKLNIPRPDFEKADWTSYKQTIDQQIRLAQPPALDQHTIDTAITQLTTIIRDADNSSIPRKRPPPTDTRERLPKYIIQLIHSKRKLRNQIDRHKRKELKPEVNRLDAQIKKIYSRTQSTEGHR